MFQYSNEKLNPNFVTNVEKEGGLTNLLKAYLDWYLFIYERCQIKQIEDRDYLSPGQNSSDEISVPRCSLLL